MIFSFVFADFPQLEMNLMQNFVDLIADRQQQF